MISIGTVYAFGVLGVSAALYLALRMWYGRERWVAGGFALLVFGLLVGVLLGASQVSWLDAGVAFSGGALARWIFEPPQRAEQQPHGQPSGDASSLVAPRPMMAIEPAGSDAGHDGSLSIVVHQIERRADLSVQEAHDLDNKAGFVLGAASFLLIGVTGLQGVAASHMMDREIVHMVQWLAVGAVLIYLGVVGAALRAYMVHESVLEPDPVGFLENHAGAPAEHTTMYLAQALLHSYLANQQIVEKKLRWTRRALRAFLAESIFLVLILVAIAVTL